MTSGIVLAAAGLLFAGIVKGAVGFGLPLLVAPVLTGFIGPRTAVVVLSLVNFASAVLVASRVRGVPLRSYVKLLAPMFMAALVGIPIGALLLATMDPTLLSALVGGTAVVFAGLSAARVQLVLPASRRRLVGILVGFGAGLLGGTTSVVGTPVAIYFHALGIPKEHFILLLNLVFVTTSLAQIVSYASLGLYTPEVLGAAGLSGALVAVGVGLGFLVHDRINQRLFNRMVIALIFVVGLNLVVRALLLH